MTGAPRAAAAAAAYRASPQPVNIVLVLLAHSWLWLGALGFYTDSKPIRFKGDFDPFRVLQLPKSSRLPDSDVLKKAFKKAALTWHPDRCSRTKPVEECETRMEEVKLAQEVLSDGMKLQQWEAWVEDKAGGSQRDQRQRGGSSSGGGSRGSGSGGPGGFDSFFSGGGGGSRPPSGPQPRPRPKAAQRPAPSPPPPPKQRPSAAAKGPWKEVKREQSQGTGGARVELITRERPLQGTPMIQVELLERTCYEAQVECQEKVLERRRRRSDEGNDEL